MYASSTFIFTAIMALARVAVATPPACLIAAMGAQTNPADLKSLCGTLQSSVVGNITEKCSGDAESSAIAVYSSTCLASASVTISIASSTSSSSATKTGSASSTVSAKATGSASASASHSGSASASGTHSPSATGTTSQTGTTTGTGAAATTSASGAGSNGPQIAFAVLAAGFISQYLL